MKYIKMGLILFSLISFSLRGYSEPLNFRVAGEKDHLQTSSSNEAAAKANTIYSSKFKSFRGINFNPLRGTLNGIATMHGAADDPQMRLLQERANEREDYIKQQINSGKKEAENVSPAKNEKEKKYRWDFLLW